IWLVSAALENELDGSCRSVSWLITSESFLGLRRFRSPICLQIDIGYFILVMASCVTPFTKRNEQVIFVIPRGLELSKRLDKMILSMVDLQVFATLANDACVIVSLNYLCAFNFPFFVEEQGAVCSMSFLLRYVW